MDYEVDDTSIFIMLWLKLIKIPAGISMKSTKDKKPKIAILLSEKDTTDAKIRSIICL